MRVMGVKGLTLYHLKSHLQVVRVRFRLCSYLLLPSCIYLSPSEFLIHI